MIKANHKNTYRFERIDKMGKFNSHFCNCKLGNENKERKNKKKNNSASDLNFILQNWGWKGFV